MKDGVENGLMYVSMYEKLMTNCLTYPFNHLFDFLNSKKPSICCLRKKLIFPLMIDEAHLVLEN